MRSMHYAYKEKADALAEALVKRKPCPTNSLSWNPHPPISYKTVNNLQLISCSLKVSMETKTMYNKANGTD